MPAFGAFMLQRDLVRQQIDRLTAAHILHGSESLCKLLRYLAQHALDQPGTPVKEYQIATEVYGRPSDFDPQSDSAIRVQAGRLRAKLAEYYAVEGANDPILVELPKGSYALTYKVRETATPPPAAVAPAPVAAPAAAPVSNARRWTAVLAFACLLLFLALAALAYNLTTRPAAVAAVPQATPLRALWRDFIAAPEEPWVIFSNAGFVGRPETGLRYYDPARDRNQQVWDHYTGVGEVLAVHSLDQVFSTFHKSVRVKRGSLFSLDDAANNNLIFVGSPSENLTLGEIPINKEFVFKRIPDGPRKGDLGIFNVHPLPGEPSYVVASASGAPLADDYAVIAFMPGINPERAVAILAGTTTFGTQGAVEFVSRPDSATRLVSQLGGDPKKAEPFEAILHVKISRGVPVESDLVAVRKRE